MLSKPPGISYSDLLAALYMANAIYDKLPHGRIHPVSLWGRLLLFAYANVRAARIGPSTVWREFAAWPIR